MTRLVHDANQIALFFASYPHDQAVASVEDHLRKFWTPRMRAQLSGLARTGGDGLHEIALEAARRLE